jgi:hypothetical protein
MHTRAIGVENARDFDRQFVLAPIIKEQRLGAAFPFIIAGARPDRVDMAPIALALGMNRWIAVDLRGRCLQDLTLTA